MRPLPMAPYIRLGITLSYLRHVPAGQPLHGGVYVLAHLESFARELEAANLPVSRALAAPLAATRDRLIGEPQGALLSDADSSEIRSCLQDMERAVLAEAQQREVYEAASTRHQTADLMTNVGRLFAADAFAKFAPLSQRDISEAARCLVAGRATASAFHVLRSTENELRALYGRFVKRNRIPEPRLWGPLVADLRKRRKHPPESLLDRLDHIRKSFRNPTQHPEAEYNMDDAQDLFALCTEVLNKMVRL